MDYTETGSSISLRDLKALNSLAIPSGPTPSIGGMPTTNRYIFYNTTTGQLGVSGLDGNFTYAFSKIDADALYKPINYVPAWADIADKPTFFSGSYNDLTDVPEPGETGDMGNAKLKEGYAVVDRLPNAEKAPFRILIAGTSITANSITGIQNFVDHAKAKYGRAGYTQDLYILGGSYEAPFLGWAKQQAATFARGRLISTVTAEPFTVSEYGRKIVVRYSKETNGKSFEVRVNGVLLTTLSCQGAQQYGVTYSYSFPTDRPINITISQVAGAGVVYLESYDIIRGTSGIITGNTALGGTGITNFMPGGMAPEFPIPVVGFNGIDGLFVNPHPDTLPDLLIITYMVNETGESQRANYETAYTRVVKGLFDKNIPVIICTEAAGIFAVGAAGGKDDYDSMVVFLKSLATTYPNVTFIDWNERLGLTTTDLPTLQTLLNRYYSGTMDVYTGAQSGDVIHCNALAYSVQAEMICKVTGLDYQGYKKPLQAMDIIENNKFRILPGLHQGSKEWFKSRFGTVEKVNYRQALCKYELVGQSIDFTASAIPLWKCSTEYNLETSITGDIANSVTSDKYGKFVNYPTDPQYVPLAFQAEASDESFVTLTFIGVNVRFAYNNYDRPAGITTVLNGEVVNLPQFYSMEDQYGGLNLDRANSVDLVPTVSHFTFKRRETATGTAIAGNLYGKVYAIYITETDFPCIPGNKTLAKPLLPMPLQLGMTTGATVFDGQRYVDIVNAKTIVKVGHSARCVNMNTGTQGVFEPTYTLEKGNIVWVPAITADVIPEYNDLLNSDAIIPQQGYNAESYIYGLSRVENAIDNFVLSGLIVNEFDLTVRIRTGGDSMFWSLKPDGTWAYNDETPVISLASLYKGVPLQTYIKFKFPDLSTRDDWYMIIKQEGKVFSTLWVLSEGTKFLM